MLRMIEEDGSETLVQDPNWELAPNYRVLDFRGRNLFSGYIPPDMDRKTLDEYGMLPYIVERGSTTRGITQRECDKLFAKWGVIFASVHDYGDAAYDNLIRGTLWETYVENLKVTREAAAEDARRESMEARAKQHNTSQRYGSRRPAPAVSASLKSALVKPPPDGPSTSTPSRVAPAPSTVSLGPGVRVRRSTPK